MQAEAGAQHADAPHVLARMRFCEPVVIEPKGLHGVQQLLQTQQGPACA